MTHFRPSTWRQEAALLFVVLVWGVNFAIVKAVLEIMHPHVLNAFRFVISIITLGGLYYQRRRRAGSPFWLPLREHGRKIAALGVLGFVFYQFSFIVGLDHTTAANAALIMASSPLWTALVGYLFRLETLRTASWLALVFVLVGTTVVVIGGAERIDFGSTTFIGNVIMLAAAVFWGAYTALSRPVLRHVSATGLTFLGLLFALPFLFGISAPYYGEVDWQKVNLWHWGAILFSGGLSTGLAVAIWNDSVNQVGASHTAVYGNLVPLVAVLSGFLMLGESISLSQIVGGSLVIGGIILSRLARRHSDHLQPEAAHPGPAPGDR